MFFKRIGIKTSWNFAVGTSTGCHSFIFECFHSIFCSKVEGSMLNKATQSFSLVTFAPWLIVVIWQHVFHVHSSMTISLHIWQLFLLQIHPYIIVWYILQMALFLFCQIISYVVKTNLWYRQLVKTSRPKLSRFQNLCISSPPQSSIFSNFWHFSILFWFFLTKHNRKTHWITEVLQSHCNIDSFKTTGLWLRPVTFESKMRPETFKTETW